MTDHLRRSFARLADHAKRTDERNDVIEDRYNTLVHKFDYASKLYNKLLDDFDFVKQENVQLGDRIAVLSSERDELDLSVMRLSSELGELQVDNENMFRYVAKVRAENETLAEEGHVMRREVERLRAIISDSRFKDGAALKDELTSLRDELAERREKERHSERERWEAERSELEHKVESLQLQLREKDEELEEAAAQQQQAQMRWMDEVDELRREIARAAGKAGKKVKAVGGEATRVQQVVVREPADRDLVEENRRLRVSNRNRAQTIKLLASKLGGHPALDADDEDGDEGVHGVVHEKQYRVVEESTSRAADSVDDGGWRGEEEKADEAEQDEVDFRKLRVADVDMEMDGQFVHLRKQGGSSVRLIDDRPRSVQDAAVRRGYNAYMKNNYPAPGPHPARAKVATTGKPRQIPVQRDVSRQRRSTTGVGKKAKIPMHEQYPINAPPHRHCDVCTVLLSAGLSTAYCHKNPKNRTDKYAPPPHASALLSSASVEHRLHKALLTGRKNIDNLWQAGEADSSARWKV